MVRCSICRLHFTSLKSLNLHYHKHSKSTIIKCLIKFSVLLTIPNIFRKRQKEKLLEQVNKRENGIKNPPMTKTLYLKDNFHILCSQNEVIIGDDQNNVNSLFSFDDSPQQTIKKYIPKLRSKSIKNLQNKAQSKRCNSDYSSRSSASSEGSNSGLINKRKLKRKKPSPRKHYHINVSKMQSTQSLDDQTGSFYTCNCRVKSKSSKLMKKADLKIITSDTESCSDTGKTMSNDTKLFCTKCGNGYKTKTELTEHMYIHETFCRLCNTAFSSKYKFREHMRLHIFKVYMCHMCGAEFPLKDMFYKHFESHIEDKTLESVLDMEQDYRILRYNFINMNYNTSINNILYYLNEYPEMNFYAYRFLKIHCDICRNEVMICDYERHLQTVHSNFFY